MDLPQWEVDLPQYKLDLPLENEVLRSCVQLCACVCARCLLLCQVCACVCTSARLCVCLRARLRSCARVPPSSSTDCYLW